MAAAHQRPGRCPPDAALHHLADLIRAIWLPADPRSFCPILRPATGGSWITLLNRAMGPLQLAQLVLDPEQLVGIRPRAAVRFVAFDVDAGSQYRHRLSELTAAIEAAGLEAITIRSSSSGGVHAYGLLPEALQREEAHWVARALTERLGWQQQQGQLELFPSSTRYTPGDAPQTFARCHGLRLPGQQGSALWLGGDRWLEDPEAIWAEFAAALELSAPSEAFAALVTEAQGLRTTARQPQRRLKPVAAAQPLGTIRHRVRWSGPGQSNANLGALANAAYLAGHCEQQQLAAAITQLAQKAPGFQQWASADTRAGLTAWAERWASSCIRRPPVASHRVSDDPGRNERLARQARVAVIEGAQRAAREAGEAALQWSQRQVAAFLGMARNTLRKLQQLWRMRVTAAVFSAPRRSGSDPSQQGGGCAGAAQQGSRLLRLKSISLAPVSPAASDCGLKPPPPTSERRRAEFAELQRWLSAA